MWFVYFTEIPPVAKAGTYVFCSCEEPLELRQVCQTELDMDKAFVSPMKGRKVGGGWNSRAVLMPTRCGNLYLYVTVDMGYRNPIFQLSV